MRGVNRNNVLPSRSSPRSNTRSCLCADTNTYSRKCCQGAMINQGIGNVTGVEDNFLTKEDDDLILQEDNSKIIL